MRLLELTAPWPPFGWTLVEQSIHERCLLATQTKIRAIDLQGLADASVVVQKLPWARDFLRDPPTYTLPGIIVSPFGSESMSLNEGTNRSDHVEYPVLVSIVAADHQHLTAQLGRYLLWREQIARIFRGHRLAGIDEILTCVVEPAPVVSNEVFSRGVFHSALMLRFLSHERRAD